MRIYRITTRHSQLVDVSTPHISADTSGIGSSVIILLAQMYSEIIQGTWNGSTDYAYNFNEYFTNHTSEANGDGLRFKCYMRKGTYKLYLYTRVGPNDGIVDIKINGSTITTIDLYADANDYDAVKTAENISITTDGIKTIDLVINGKNASSNGYNIFFSALCFILTGE